MWYKFVSMFEAKCNQKFIVHYPTENLKNQIAYLVKMMEYFVKINDVDSCRLWKLLCRKRAVPRNGLDKQLFDHCT